MIKVAHFYSAGGTFTPIDLFLSSPSLFCIMSLGKLVMNDADDPMSLFSSILKDIAQ